jgi:hypothetical protein
VLSYSAIQVVSYHLRQPKLLVEIGVTAAATRARVQQRILAAALAYERVWETIKHDIKAFCRGRPAGLDPEAFLIIDYFGRDGNEPHVSETGQLGYDKATGGFISKVVESDREMAEEMTVWSQKHGV